MVKIVCFILYDFQFSSVQSLSHVQLFATPWIAIRQASLSITISRSSLKLTSIKSVMPSSHLILRCPLLLLPPIPPSIRVFSNELTLRMRWPKYWSFNFSIIPSKEHPGLISFRMDWLDLLAVQGTLKSLLQHHSSKASILRRSAFFTVQLPHPNMTTGKTIALTRWTFVGKVMSLLLNMLYRLVITFLPCDFTTIETNFLKKSYLTNSGSLLIYLSIALSKSLDICFLPCQTALLTTDRGNIIQRTWSCNHTDLGLTLAIYLTSPRFGI